MAWTTPGTATTGGTFTAAQYNAWDRDNMNETYPAVVSAAGDLAYADGANSLTRLAHPGATGYLLASNGASGVAWRQIDEAVNWSTGAADTLINTTYSASPGGDSLPSVTVTTGTLALVFVSAIGLANNTGGEVTYISYSVSGASSVSAADAQGALHESGAAGDTSSAMAVRLQTLTAGSNTFSMEAKVSAGTGTITRPRLLVIAL